MWLRYVYQRGDVAAAQISGECCPAGAETRGGRYRVAAGRAGRGGRLSVSVRCARVKDGRGKSWRAAHVASARRRGVPTASVPACRLPPRLPTCWANQEATGGNLPLCGIVFGAMAARGGAGDKQWNNDRAGRIGALPARTVAFPLPVTPALCHCAAGRKNYAYYRAGAT